MKINSAKTHMGVETQGPWLQQVAEIGNIDVTISKFKRGSLIDLSTHGVLSMKTETHTLITGTEVTTITLMNDEGDEITLKAFKS